MGSCQNFFFYVPVSWCLWMQNDLLLGHNLCLLRSLQSPLTILAPLVKPTKNTCKSEEMITLQGNSGHNIELLYINLDSRCLQQNSLEYNTVPTKTLIKMIIS